MEDVYDIVIWTGVSSDSYYRPLSRFFCSPSVLFCIIFSLIHMLPLYFPFLSRKPAVTGIGLGFELKQLFSGPS
jgi:hypothetical protein